MLIVLPVADQPSRSSLDRLTHEYELKDQLDGAWAVRPLDLVRDAGRTMLVLDDAGDEPLDRPLGAPLQAGRFLCLAIGIAVTVGKLRKRGLDHKNIQPVNILVNGATGDVRMTGMWASANEPRGAVFQFTSPAPREEYDWLTRCCTR